MNRVEIKERAKAFAFNNKLNLWMPYLVMMVVSLIYSAFVSIFHIEKIALLNVLVSICYEVAILPAGIGTYYYTLSLVRGKKLDVKEALTTYYKFLPIILVTFLLVGIFGFLWSLLLIVPGIIYYYKMAMVAYLLADEDLSNTDATDIMKKSEEMMNGYKMDYFIFNLSFLGWALLIPLTLGIAAIWVVPYINAANAMYFEELKKVKNV